MEIPALNKGGGSVQPVTPSGGTNSGGGSPQGGAGAAAYGPAALVSLSPEARNLLASMAPGLAPDPGKVEELLKTLGGGHAAGGATRGAGGVARESLAEGPAASEPPRNLPPGAEQVRYLVQFLVEQDRRMNAATGATARQSAQTSAGSREEASGMNGGSPSATGFLANQSPLPQVAPGGPEPGFVLPQAIALSGLPAALIRLPGTARGWLANPAAPAKAGGRGAFPWLGAKLLALLVLLVVMAYLLLR